MRIQKISLLKYTKEISKENKELMMIEVKEEVVVEEVEEVEEIEEDKEDKEEKGAKEIKEVKEVKEDKEDKEVVVEIEIKETKKSMLISKQENNQIIRNY